jgi:hypothetical protein
VHLQGVGNGDECVLVYPSGAERTQSLEELRVALATHPQVALGLSRRSLWARWRLELLREPGQSLNGR